MYVLGFKFWTWYISRHWKNLSSKWPQFFLWQELLYQIQGRVQGGGAPGGPWPPPNWKNGWFAGPWPPPIEKWKKEKIKKKREKKKGNGIKRKEKSQQSFFHIVNFVYFLDLRGLWHFSGPNNPLAAYPQDSKVRPFGAKIKLEFGRLP